MVEDERVVDETIALAARSTGGDRGISGHAAAEDGRTAMSSAVTDRLVHLHRTLGSRYEPPRVLREKVAAGELGKKSGKGFYEWPTTSS